MKKYILLTALIALLLAACSSTYRRPESIEDKMKRFNPQSEQSNIVPQITSTSKGWKTRRGPASSELPTSTGGNYRSLSNKKVYFTALLYQYNQVRPLAKGSTPSISICPHFHNQVLEYANRNPKAMKKQNFIANWIIDKSKLKDPKYLEIRPELGLPTKVNGIIPTLADNIISDSTKTPQDHLKTSINVHLENNYNEIKELCQTGQSNNYYAFENLVGHTRENAEFKATNANLNSLLKTSVFANHAIITSLWKYRKRGRTIASTENSANNPVIYEITNRMNANWALDYFRNLSKN